MMGAQTRAVGAGRREEWTGRVVNPPIWRGSTHLYATEGERQDCLKYNEDGRFHYGRRGGPTQWALAEALTELEPGADGTMLYPSGTAALAGSIKKGGIACTVTNTVMKSLDDRTQLARDVLEFARTLGPIIR